MFDPVLDLDLVRDDEPTKVTSSVTWIFFLAVALALLILLLTR